MHKTSIFIEKARAKHGDRYGYDRVVYIRAHDKVIITCTNHGDFEQRPSAHLRGDGCDKCGKESMVVKRLQESRDGFIEKARAVHGERYSYDRVVYVQAHDKVIITCKIHGDFKQTPNNHLTAYGCTECGIESRAAKKTQKAKNSFIEKACATHGDKYDYSRVFYIHSKDKVAITCKIHGDFEQSPSDHLSGAGCPLCPARYDQPTNLYLMYNGLGKVKVGFSIDAGARLSRLNSNAPFEAELLETWTLPDTPTVRKIESKVHRKLAKYHAGLSGFDGASEWFNTSPDTARKHILKALSGAEVLGYSEADSLQLALI